MIKGKWCLKLSNFFLLPPNSKLCYYTARLQLRVQVSRGLDNAYNPHHDNESRGCMATASICKPSPFLDPLAEVFSYSSNHEASLS